MKITKPDTENYLLSDIDRLDPVTVYVTNYGLGEGNIVISCSGKAWSSFWPGMGDMNLQAFFLSANNEYLIGNFINQEDQIDFDAINKLAHEKGISLDVNSDVEIECYSDEMAVIFGYGWRMDLPRCPTHEYTYLNRIINAIKEAFTLELQEK